VKIIIVSGILGTATLALALVVVWVVSERDARWAHEVQYPEVCSVDVGVEDVDECLGEEIVVTGVWQATTDGELSAPNVLGSMWQGFESAGSPAGAKVTVVVDPLCTASDTSIRGVGWLRIIGSAQRQGDTVVLHVCGDPTR
jgi:hypothetical protein